MSADPLTEKIIGMAIEVHKGLGPGLLESAYEACLSHELTSAGLQISRQLPVPLSYKGINLECGYRADIVVENTVLLELKAIDQILPIHKAQLLTYLRLTRLRVGLLMNFNVSMLRDGLHRMVL